MFEEDEERARGAYLLLSTVRADAQMDLNLRRREDINENSFHHHQNSAVGICQRKGEGDFREQ